MAKKDLDEAIEYFKSLNKFYDTMYDNSILQYTESEYDYSTTIIKEYDKINEEMDSLKKKNEELMKDILILNKEMTDFNKCWLHKDKITKKIEELDKMELLGEIDFETIKFTIKILKELRGW